jgi:hypothetical protein
MSSHTPGPYGICGNLIYTETTGFSVAKISNEHPEQTHANALLFKAAPDLLEELEWMLDKATQAGWPTYLLKPAQEAVKKARGET